MYIVDCILQCLYYSIYITVFTMLFSVDSLYCCVLLLVFDYILCNEFDCVVV